jgi:hypothetical protein
MHESQARIHYAPASVGALIDTALLRRAIRDAEGGKPDEFVPASRRAWHTAIRALVLLRLVRRGVVHVLVFKRRRNEVAR